MQKNCISTAKKDTAVKLQQLFKIKLKKQS